MDCNLPGSSVHGILQARILEWGAISGAYTQSRAVRTWSNATYCLGSNTVPTLVFVVVQSPSRILLFATPWTAALQASLSFTISGSLFKVMSVELVTLSNHLIFCLHLLLLFSISSSIRVFSKELANTLQLSCMFLLLLL